MPPFSFDFHDSQKVQMLLQGASMRLTLAFSIQQQQYPFISDHGTGEILIDNATLSATMHAIMLGDCPNHIGAEAESSRFQVSKLQIQLNSQY